MKKALCEAVSTKISSDTTLMGICAGGAHEGLAPLGTRTPFLLVQWLESATVWTLKVPICEEHHFQVKIVDEGFDSGAAIIPGMDRLEALLNNQPLTVKDQKVWVLRKTGDIPIYPDPPDGSGRCLRQGGQIYKVVVA